MEPPEAPGKSTAAPEEEPRYGGFTRFEIELEVRAGQLGVPMVFTFALCPSL